MNIKEFLKNYSFKKRHIFYLLLFFTALYVVTLQVSCTDYVMKPDISSLSKGNNNQFNYDLPLDAASPWPKFRCNSLQNGRSTVLPEKSGLQPWEYNTGKGIFSSPVIDGDGNIYVGSADHYFYALDAKGKIKWRHLTNEIIDSSALLDDQGRIFVGSGDGYVYAFERKKGKLLWKFKAHTPAEVTKLYGMKTYNLNWFEGNIGILKDGTLLAPNDNYLVYTINRITGKPQKPFKNSEMGWSLPAVNTETGRIFFGSTFAALKNTFCYDTATGKKVWKNGGLGTVAASIMLTSNNPDGAAVVGGFDGILRAYAQDDGFQIWKFGARGHIYASPAQLSDGTIVQPSADGTLYAINPEDGTLKWAFDTREPIRSSPAVDGEDNIYFGNGEGRLFCVNPNGTLKWAYQCITDDRNDLNASPALGKKGVYVAGENGGIFFIPYDYPDSAAGKRDPRCVQGPGEDLPSEGNHLFFTTRFGGLKLKAPESIDANEPLAFSLFVRKKGDTVLAAIDKETLKVSFSGGKEGKVNVSADRKFITIIPREKWTGSEGGILTINLKGTFITEMSRIGLKFFGGSEGGIYDQTFTFKINARKNIPMPYKIPAKQGDASSMFVLSRLAAPSPAILPSWNQIGFDSLHYLYGIVEGKGDNAVLWGVRGKLEGKDKKTVVDTAMNDRFPLMLNHDNGLLTLFNYEGFLLDFNGTWDMPYAFYRLAAPVDTKGKLTKRPALNAIARCDEIEFYGKFLKLTGMSEFDTGLMYIYGGSNLDIYGKGFTRGPGTPGDVSFSTSDRAVSITVKEGTLKKNAHVYGLLLIDTKTGKPVSANYAGKTTVTSDASVIVTGVTLQLDDDSFTGSARIYYMVDTYPAAKGEVEIK